jgi:RimK-like ATP-grasp domain
MIIVCGIPSETSIVRLVEALEQQGASYLMVNQRSVASSSIEFEATGDGDAEGTLVHNGQMVALSAVTGVYLRFMDDRLLPEVRDLPDDSPLRAHSRAFHDLLPQWAEVTEARVINRYSAMGSNYSKPYQLQLISEHGLSVPETLITNDPDQVEAFRAKHRRLIYKSISSERSIVAEYTDADLDRIERIRWCPVQFQALVEGYDVRVHTVGEHAFATRVMTSATDYRYARLQTGEAAEFEPFELDDELAGRCVALAAALGLEMAGIDLRLSPDGRAYCFEVNPSPVYSYYEAHTDQPISMAVAAYLAGHGRGLTRSGSSRAAETG